jgi:undecaprenyl diphosphate synthase
MFDAFNGIILPDTAEATALAAIDPARVPAHIAVIMDGNGRWARQRGKPRVFGHRAGSESVKAIIDTCARLGVKVVTLYAFSTENWKRPRSEVSALMTMLKRVIKREIDEVASSNIRFQTIGDTGALSEDVQAGLQFARERTAANDGMIMNVALNYGSRAELVRAARLAAEQLSEQGRLPSELNEDDIARNLYTHNLPDVDLLIRTSGEFRISNFLLWQIAYSEIYVTPTYFPDFRRPQVLEAIIDYQKRDRRFGGIRK